MSKIGILTFHNALNYGAIIQVWALQEYLTSNGHQVEVIDYRNKNIERSYNYFPKLMNLLGLKQEIVHFIFKLANTDIYFRKKKGFKVFTKTKIKLSKEEVLFPEQISNLYDVFIVGSDQVWNPYLTGGFDYFYFLNFPTGSSKKISYAASLEPKNILNYSFDRSDLGKMLDGFDAISVRENSISETLKEYTRKNIEVVLDPSLLINKSVYDKLNLKPILNKKYILVFHLVRHKNTLKIAQKIAKQNNLEIVELHGGFKNFSIKNRDLQGCSPSTFLSLIKFADTIVTTSFHGTTLSIVFNKTFFTIDTGHSNRQKSLLYSLGLDDRFISEIDQDLESKVNETIDYTKVEKNLLEYRIKSENFLKSVI